MSGDPSAGLLSISLIGRWLGTNECRADRPVCWPDAGLIVHRDANEQSVADLCAARYRYGHLAYPLEEAMNAGFPSASPMPAERLPFRPCFPERFRKGSPGNRPRRDPPSRRGHPITGISTAYQDTPATAKSPNLHDGRLLPLEETVEFFDLIFEMKHTATGKQGLGAVPACAL